MKIQDRIDEIQAEVNKLVGEAKELSLLYHQGHRDTDLKLPDNVVPFPVSARLH